MSFYLPLWGIITVGGIVGWSFGFKLIGAFAILAGFVMGGFINF